MRARDYALLQLDAKHLPGWPNDVFKQHLRPSDMPRDPRELALADNITLGVVKNVLLLRYLIGLYAQRDVEEIDPKLQKILAVAIYQLRFLTRIPASAAVNEAVEQSKHGGNMGAAGFVNAVLRRAARGEDAPMPDPLKEPVEYARIALSHPSDVYKRIQALVGDEQALAICRHNNEEPPTIVRLGPAGKPEMMEGHYLQASKHSLEGSYIVEGAKQATFAQWADLGIAQVQDPTATRVVDYCDLQPGQAVLDRCCGLGTKTLQLADRIGPTGRVVGIDPSAKRVSVIRQLLARRKLSTVAVVQCAMMRDLPVDLPQRYDRALLDVPCSNSGVLARRAEARYHQDEATLQSVKKLQTEILEDTATHVAISGRLIYSTCSIWPEENQQQIAAFLAVHPEFKQLHDCVTLPSTSEDLAQYHDGGYVAVLERV